MANERDAASEADACLDGYRVRYEADRNPLWAWIAYKQARDLGAAVPAWVLSYLDGVAAGLWGHGTSVRKALGFDFPGRGTRYNQYLKAHRDMALAYAVAEEISANVREKGRPFRETAYADVAKRYGLSVHTVKRAFLAFGRRAAAAFEKVRQHGATRSGGEPTPGTQNWK